MNKPVLILNLGLLFHGENKKNLLQQDKGLITENEIYDENHIEEEDQIKNETNTNFSVIVFIVIFLLIFLFLLQFVYQQQDLVSRQTKKDKSSLGLKYTSPYSIKFQEPDEEKESINPSSQISDTSEIVDNQMPQESHNFYVAKTLEKEKIFLCQKQDELNYKICKPNLIADLLNDKFFESILSYLCLSNWKKQDFFSSYISFSPPIEIDYDQIMVEAQNRCFFLEDLIFLVDESIKISIFDFKEKKEKIQTINESIVSAQILKNVISFFRYYIWQEIEKIKKTLVFQESKNITELLIKFIKLFPKKNELQNVIEFFIDSSDIIYTSISYKGEEEKYQYMEFFRYFNFLTPNEYRNIKIKYDHFQKKTIETKNYFILPYKQIESWQQRFENLFFLDGCSYYGFFGEIYYTDCAEKLELEKTEMEEVFLVLEAEQKRKTEEYFLKNQWNDEDKQIEEIADIMAECLLDKESLQKQIDLVKRKRQ